MMMEWPFDSKREGFEAYLLTWTWWTQNWLLLRLFRLTHSRQYSKACQLTINNIIKLNKTVHLCFGRWTLRTQLHILLLYHLQYALTTLQFRNIWDQPWCHTYIILLLEVPFCAYFVYQLLLMAWLGALLTNLSTYYLNPRLGLFPSSQSRRQLIQFYRVYISINSVQQRVHKLWLRVSVVLFVLLLQQTQELASNLYNMIYHQPINQKIEYECCVAPVLKIFLLAVCNKRIKMLKQQLREHLFRTEFLHWHWFASGVQSAVGIPFAKILSRKVR
ncbi:uncharacterized protein CG31750-like [Drosophila hydei]|uniref:Uncharacterized protein CG31750-like n=1 Tax=Drosophila hydei TaxID=7224 RepID=A0A6J2SW14_DROHY|nr:uncharacterized protein CG31750-like [Drosophila hydei]